MSSSNEILASHSDGWVSAKATTKMTPDELEERHCIHGRKQESWNFGTLSVQKSGR